MSKLLEIILLIAFIPVICFAQWMLMPSSPPGYFLNIVVVNDTLYASHWSNGAYKSIDGTASWQQINNGLNNGDSRHIYEILFFEGNLYAATVDGIYKSTSNGNEWIKKSNGITIGPGALREFCESIYEYNGNLFTGAWNGIYGSTDNAENWTVTNATGQGINAKNFAINNGVLFAARENINTPNGYTSVDSGFTWNPLTSITFPTITFFPEGTELWMGTIHGVWLSTDNGLSWETRSTGLSPDPYSSSILRINGNLITSLKFGGSGMFCSSDEGLNWQNWGEGLPFLNSIEKLIVYNKKIIAATSSGLWQRDTSEVVTILDTQENLAINEYKIIQNYPNPFNPSTKINWQSPVGSHQTLKVYDVLGNEVATLVDEYRPAGSYEIEFDASELTSGIYFFRLQSENFLETKKMILLR